ncbi:NTPase [Operophtera brumata]|uniref:NTPase n=1 Tax=Operophtera brumata TaxID=104452 RepID=A0A0L7KVL9_OPEBR|nr:NTPase [Operophtera brumata]
MATLDWEPSEPPKGTVAAMSYFYDVAADAAIIGELTIRDGDSGLGAKRAPQRDTMNACSAANVDQPWACIDLVYVMTLLRDVYKIKPHEAISKVNGHEVSWALGLAYTTVMNNMAAAAH